MSFEKSADTINVTAKKALLELESKEIIRKVDFSTDCVSPIVKKAMVPCVYV